MGKVIAVGVLLWGFPMVALTSLLGLEHQVTQMSGFFTKAALLTFGGAYAVLPCVSESRDALRLAYVRANNGWAGAW